MMGFHTWVERSRETFAEGSHGICKRYMGRLPGRGAWEKEVSGLSAGLVNIIPIIVVYPATRTQ